MPVMKYWSESEQKVVAVSEERPLPMGGGAAGQDGKSAYEIAVDNGFDGSEIEWLASLEGEKGDRGSSGADGDDGKTFTYGDFTQEQLGELKGPKGDPGTDGFGTLEEYDDIIQRLEALENQED